MSMSLSSLVRIKGSPTRSGTSVTTCACSFNSQEKTFTDWFVYLCISLIAAQRSSYKALIFSIQNDTSPEVTSPVQPRVKVRLYTCLQVTLIGSSRMLWD